MGRAGTALKQALEAYGISQNKLAVALGLDRSKVYRWFHEKIDPQAETVAEIVKALNDIAKRCRDVRQAVFGGFDRSPGIENLVKSIV